MFGKLSLRTLEDANKMKPFPDPNSDCKNIKLNLTDIRYTIFGKPIKTPVSMMPVKIENEKGKDILLRKNNGS